MDLILDGNLRDAIVTSVPRIRESLSFAMIGMATSVPGWGDGCEEVGLPSFVFLDEYMQGDVGTSLLLWIQQVCAALVFKALTSLG